MSEMKERVESCRAHLRVLLPPPSWPSSPCPHQATRPPVLPPPSPLTCCLLHLSVTVRGPSPRTLCVFCLFGGGRGSSFAKQGMRCCCEKEGEQPGGGPGVTLNHISPSINSTTAMPATTANPQVDTPTPPSITSKLGGLYASLSAKASQAVGNVSEGIPYVVRTVHAHLRPLADLLRYLTPRSPDNTLLLTLSNTSSVRSSSITSEESVVRAPTLRPGSYSCSSPRGKESPLTCSPAPGTEPSPARRATSGDRHSRRSQTSSTVSRLSLTH